MVADRERAKLLLMMHICFPNMTVDGRMNLPTLPPSFYNHAPLNTQSRHSKSLPLQFRKPH